MALTEINFDGLIGPTHNFAGLSVGNIASTHHAGQTARPRAAALQGLAKMRTCLDLGLAQGIFPPLARPNEAWLRDLGTDLASAEPVLRAQAWSASSMWAANAATVSPSPDTGDGRTHLTPANLLTMPHRRQEAVDTAALLRKVFADPGFVVHDPVSSPFGDEGAANHMRLCGSHADPGVEIFVYGEGGGDFPARQHVEASRTVARLHGLSPGRTLMIRQSTRAIAAGAFHNDVVAVANENVLLVHEDAFEDRENVYATLQRLVPDLIILEAPARSISLEAAVASYLFNAQLVTLAEGAGMALIVPTETRDTPGVWNWLEGLVASGGPIKTLQVADLRQSMANGGGPACLRLRVVCDPRSVDPRFLLDHGKLDQLEFLVTRFWPETICPADLLNSNLLNHVRTARRSIALLFA